MRGYLIRRLLAVIPTLLLASMLVFAVVRVIPGDIIDLMISQHDVSEEEVTRETIRKVLGLDVPIHVQYYRWVKEIFLHGSLGDSMWRDRTVISEIVDRLPVTFELGIIALVIGLSLAFPIGIYSAIRQDTAGDYVGRTIAILGVAIPGFWLGTMIVVYPALWWDWSPSINLIPFREDPIKNMGTFLVPGAVLGFGMAGVTMRMTRAMMLEVLRQDYIRTAWAKGLRERIVIIRHAVKNALIPVITLIGLQLPILVGGTVIIEQIFVLPGMGLLMLEAIQQRDYPIVTGVMGFIGLIVLAVNVLVDISYGFLDPKVRYN
ncbi:MAG: ABC transporter permease [Deltaproteobacteria bacterium]|nr:ABC transporter permease [Deltaproteobacteria bacterium]